MNREKNVCTHCRSSKVKVSDLLLFFFLTCLNDGLKCARDLGGLACSRCLKRGLLCILAPQNRRMTNYNIPRSHNEPHLHNHQGLQSSFSTQVHNLPHNHNEPHLHDYRGLQSPFSTQAHNLADSMHQAIDHVNTGQLYPPFPDYYFRGYSIPVVTYQQQEAQENAVVDAVTNNFDNMFSSLNDPIWNTGG